MYNEDVKNESCETRQRRKVVVVTSEKYYLKDIKKKAQ